MKKLICALLCVMVVFLFSATAFAGSVPQEYGDISISFYKKGDANRDKKIDQKDVDRLLQYSAGWNINVTVRSSEADMNSDGKIDGLDAVQLMQQLAGLK